MAKKETAEILSIDGHEVHVTHPAKLYFSKQITLSKLDLVRYYLSIAPGALAGIRNRPLVLKRFVNGAEEPAFYQKRAPGDHPSWLRTVTFSFPSGRTAEELVVENVAGLVWVVNLGCIELHPHAIRSTDLDHPDELRIDLDPGPGVPWEDVRRVALEVHAFLEELGLRGWPKTSGSRGMHIYVRIEPRWTFEQVRRAALALSREIERRAPALATSKWWKEERHGVFLDYNQNAKDRTTASAYSVRPVSDARVSTPLSWPEVGQCDPGDFTVLTVPQPVCRDRRSACRNGFPCRLSRKIARSGRQGRHRGPWRCAVAASLPQGGRRSSSRRSLSRKENTHQDAARSRREFPDKEAALAGLGRWKAKHESAATYLEPDDVLVDSMRGRSSTWTRVRVNLRHVPEEIRPVQEIPDPDDDPVRAARKSRRQAAE